jgi:hypothetical protein
VIVGHFLNEDLGALLLLDSALPTGIPLLWPKGGIATHFLNELQKEGLISDRKMIMVDNQPHHIVAHRVYFFRSSREWNEGPWMTWYTQRLVQQTMLSILAKKTDYSAMDDAKYHIVLLERKGGSGSRQLENHNDLLSSLKVWLPEDEGFSHDSFVPGPDQDNPMWKTGERIYKGCLLIGPHGGNMPNMVFMRPGCWIIEIGYVDPQFNLPTDFYCFARNLGLTYWLSVAEGIHATPLRANLEDLREIVSAYRHEVLGL